MKKRVLSTLLALCLLAGLLPRLFLAAPTDGPKELSSHLRELKRMSLAAPADEPQAQARYQTEADGSWHDGSLDEALSQVYEGGTVVVLEDVHLDAPLTIQKPLTLTSADPDSPCTLFYTTKAQGDDWLLTVRANATLAHILLDGGREEGLTAHTELVGVQNKVTLILGAGAILQNNDNIDTAQGAGGLRVVRGQAVLQDGSAIRNCRAVAGGGAAVTADGRLVLNGGVIENCQAFVGGGIFLKENGIVQIYSGAIRGNEARKELEGMSYGFSIPEGCGGAIAVDQGYVFLLGGEEGGLLTENYAEDSGGGIYVYNGLLQLANGVITKNKSERYGGGILASPYAYLVVGLVPRVTGNTGGNRHEGVFDNVYLDSENVNQEMKK